MPRGMRSLWARYQGAALGAHYRKYRPHQVAQLSTTVKAHMLGSGRCKSIWRLNPTPVLWCENGAIKHGFISNQGAPYSEPSADWRITWWESNSGREGKNLASCWGWPGNLSTVPVNQPVNQPYCGWLARPLEGKVLGGICEQDWGPGRRS